jgi:hypothetical protein
MSLQLNLSNDFCSAVETLVMKMGCQYIEAILIAAEKAGLEPEQAGALINRRIKEFVEMEAIDLHYLPGVEPTSARLPV